MTSSFLWRLSPCPRAIANRDFAGFASFPCRGRLLGDLLTDEVLDLEHHSANRRRILKNADVPHFPQPQSPDGAQVVLWGPGETLEQRDFERHRSSSPSGAKPAWSAPAHDRGGGRLDPPTAGSSGH